MQSLCCVGLQQGDLSKVCAFRQPKQSQFSVSQALGGATGFMLIFSPRAGSIREAYIIYKAESVF